MTRLWGGSQAAETVGADTATSALTTLTSNAAANTKGSWVELSATTTYDTAQIIVWFKRQGTQNFLIDIGIGAAGSEVVLVPNLHIASVLGITTPNLCFSYSCPIAVPKGVRLAARCQDGAGSLTIQIGVTLIAASPFNRGYQRAETIGTVNSILGANIDAGATANTKGSWGQISAATSFDYKALIPVVYSQSNAPASDQDGLVDIGIGAAASEVVVLPNLPFSAESVAGNRSATALPLTGIYIPSGSRVAARAQCSTNDDTNSLRRARVGLIGFG